MSSFKILFFTLGGLALALIAQKQGATAQIFTTGQLDKHCRSYLKLIKSKGKGKGKLTKKQAVDIVKCISFVAAFHYGKTATNILNDTLGPYCLPTRQQTTSWLVKNFVRWVSTHPRQKNKVAGIGIMKSLQEHYGCDERDRVKE